MLWNVWLHSWNNWRSRQYSIDGEIASRVHIVTKIFGQKMQSVISSIDSLADTDQIRQYEGNKQEK